ncbi:hypothetical protein DFH11DRAFT_1512863 [Phellopilus nigrolimitatus]|nr:hypothetical protein DFH11DRAFT_1512863 [Phellopilus nigrolimitatus]
MMNHWQDLQQHILPGVLGAVRIANPGVNVQIFWETTGKAQDQRASQKSQRHFNDFPDIDIVGLPRNKLSPLFIRQSIDLFLSGNTPELSVTRHLFIVAMSNSADDSSGKSNSPQQSHVDDAKWEAVAGKLQENDVFLHVIANPVARLSRVFELFRKTMRYQSRQEVIPWQPTDTLHCICHLSGSNRAVKARDSIPVEWPEVFLGSPESPSSTTNSPPAHAPELSDEELPSPISPIDMINSNPGSLSLVSRMQAMHGLASRRRPAEKSRRPSMTRTSFFRETSPVPSPRRERLVNSKNTNKEKEKLRQLSMITGPTQPDASFSSALDLRGLTQETSHQSPTEAPLANGSNGYMSVGAGMPGFHPPSPDSDTSGSTLSSSLTSLSSQTYRIGDSVTDDGKGSARRGPSQPVTFFSETGRFSSAQALASPSSPNVSFPASSEPTFPLSPLLFQTPFSGPLPYGTYASSAYAPYTSYSGGASLHPGFSRGANTVQPPGARAHSSDIDTDVDVDVVPASAPPDVRGQVPFVFDAAYEAQSAARLRNAIHTMHEVDEVHDPAMAHGLNSRSNETSMNWQEHENLQGNNGFSDVCRSLSQIPVSLTDFMFSLFSKAQELITTPIGMRACMPCPLGAKNIRSYADRLHYLTRTSHQKPKLVCPFPSRSCTVFSFLYHRDSKNDFYILSHGVLLDSKK